MADTIQHRLGMEHNEILDQAEADGEAKVVVLSLDQLDYMADLVAELREMSQRSGLTTLAAILALAQTEAAQQITKRRVG
jgi:hypothetical protein